MSHKFKAEDFYDAINSIGALGTFPHDLGDYFIRNSDKYKEACTHLHKDMLEQTHIVVNMDTIPKIEKIHPFKFGHSEMLLALQSNKVGMKRMLSVTRFLPEGGNKEEMIIVPIIQGQQKHHWNPVGIMVFVRDLDNPDTMQVRTQEFPGAIAGSEKQNKLMAIMLDAMNMIATITSTATVVIKKPSKLKMERAAQKNIALEPFLVMSAST